MTRGLETSWRYGDPLEVGKILYERLDPRRRPSWAVGVLDACCSALSTVPAEVEAVREIASTPARWMEARAAFQAVRSVVLANESRSRLAQTVDEAMLYLAENVAKVTYNATGASAPYDHDAGWWVAKNARALVELSTDAALGARVWKALATR
jgi:hypothetical protein